jgi:hypothetical protein
MNLKQIVLHSITSMQWQSQEFMLDGAELKLEFLASPLKVLA